MIKFDVTNRFSGEVQFTAEIDCAENEPRSIKLGLAVKWAIKARANLTGANLTGAKLTGAYLTDAYLARANLTGAKGLDLPPPDVAEARIRQIAEIVTAKPEALNMRNWHTCETTHCIAGWAVHLAGEWGARLERERGSAMAGLTLLGPEAAAHFYDTDADAMAWLRSKLPEGEIAAALQEKDNG